ncbi:hypothetical protein [Longimicrobium sp.]|uniref:hypothetical protein n=1 Tax=Longimicrobium sp. TaxID=2029185 RepID=UPI003B3A6CA9
MSDAALRSNDEMPEDPQAWREEFRRRMAERGVNIRLPRAGATWEPPEHPLPIDADEMSRFVVELRRTGKL